MSSPDASPRETGTSAAYFDVDGTLVATNLLQPTLYYLLNQARPEVGLARLGRALLGAPAMALAELRDRRLFNELLFSNFAGMTEDRIVIVAPDVFEEIIKPRIFRGAIDLVAKCKAAGQRVVLITGSLDQTTEIFARHIGADACITNRLEFKDGKATGKLLRPVVAGPEKANLIVQDAKANGHDLSRCHAYSDSYSDVPMLSVVGHPNCVNPDSKLARLARAYRWPILDIDVPARGSVPGRA